MQGEGRDRARAESTLNILPMTVTLDVSKFSGWLNVPALCRESKGGQRVRKREGAGRGSASGVQGEGSARYCGRRARAERTENMFSRFVTLDVSKLSGWLNANAFCCEWKGGHAERGVRQETGGCGARAQAACRAGRDW